MAERKTSTKYLYAIGRRKSSVATLRLFEGKGECLINGKKAGQIYRSSSETKRLYSPLEILEVEGKYHFSAKVTGGGKSSQLGAIKLALARALEKVDESFRNKLKKAKLLSCDSRRKERKKPGLKKARKKEQYSKR